MHLVVKAKNFGMRKEFPLSTLGVLTYTCCVFLFYEMCAHSRKDNYNYSPVLQAESALSFTS